MADTGSNSKGKKQESRGSGEESAEVREAERRFKEQQAIVQGLVKDLKEKGGEIRAAMKDKNEKLVGRLEKEEEKLDDQLKKEEERLGRREKEMEQAIEDERQAQGVPQGPFDITVVVRHKGDASVHFDKFPQYVDFRRNICGDHEDGTIFGKPKTSGANWIRFTEESYMKRFSELSEPYMFTVKKGGSPTTTPDRPKTQDSRIPVDDLANAIKERLVFEENPIPCALDLCDEFVEEEPFQFDTQYNKCTLRELGNHFPFVSRDDDVKKFFDVVRDQYFSWLGRKPDSTNISKSIKLLTYCGASGMGKSRMSRELLKAMCEVKNDNVEFCNLLEGSLNDHLSVVVGMDVVLEEWEKKHHKSAVAARVLYAYCYQFKAFRKKYPSYEVFQEMKECRKLSLKKVVESIRDLFGDDRHRLFLLCFDEVNHVESGWIKVAVPYIQALWKSSGKPVFVVPCLFGTNPASVYKTSKSGPHNIQPSLMSAGDFWDILMKLFALSSEEVSDQLAPFLEDITFNPRLLELSLYHMSESGCAMNEESASPRNRVSSPFDSDVVYEDIRHFLMNAKREHYVDVFKRMVCSIDTANFMTVTEWENLSDIRSAVLAHTIFGTGLSLSSVLLPVESHSKDKEITVGDAVENGWVFWDGTKIVLPYAYLYYIFRNTAIGSTRRAVVLHLVGTPTKSLSSDQNEKQDLNATLYRLLLAGLAGETSLSLPKWLCCEDIEEVQVRSIVEAITPTALGHQCTSSSAAGVDLNSVGAYLNAKGAPSWDSAVIVEVAEGIPEAFCKTVGISGSTEADNAVKKLNAKPTWKGINFTDSTVYDHSGSRYLMVAIQSKRKLSSAGLSITDIWEEYGKIRGFAKVIPVVFLIISDGEKPEVPSALKQQVAVITDDDMESFFGPIVGSRRKPAS